MAESGIDLVAMPSPGKVVAYARPRRASHPMIGFLSLAHPA
jgi:hypothetical protein